jgi:CubicO group peptidase (beta-lactamase class C family)
VLTLAGSSRSQDWNPCVHGYTDEQYDAWARKVEDAKTHRIAYVSVFNAGGSPAESGTPYFAARAVPNPSGLAWHAKPDLSNDDFDREVKAFKKLGYHLECVCSYFKKDNSRRFAAIWLESGSPAQIREYVNLSYQAFRDILTAEKRRGWMPKMISADRSGTFCALFSIQPSGLLYEDFHDLTADQYQIAIDQWSVQHGYCPTSIAVYPTEQGPRFAGIFVKNGRRSKARLNLFADEYQTEFDQMSKDGYLPVSIAGYENFQSNTHELFDRAMQNFMEKRGIRAGTLAVSRDKQTVFAKGYGFADADGKRPMQADDPMRLASATKAITAAAVRKLVREGKSTLDTKAFPLLGLKPPPERTPDPRLDDITIRHLLEHKGGWVASETFDPMFHPLRIASDMKSAAPPSPVDVIRYMMGRKLQFDPGSKTSYSNFGYCVLGRVIEKVSGQTYPAYVKEHILAPLGVKSVELGRTLPKYRNPREPIYLDPGKDRNIFDPDGGKVPAPDGTFCLETMDSHGGLIGSASDLVRFLSAYWINGEPRQGNGPEYGVIGSLPGAYTLLLQRPNGVNVAAFFNQRSDASGHDYGEIQNLIREAADRQTASVVRYAAVWIKGD